MRKNRTAVCSSACVCIYFRFTFNYLIGLILIYKYRQKCDLCVTNFVLQNECFMFIMGEPHGCLLKVTSLLLTYLLSK